MTTRGKTVAPPSGLSAPGGLDQLLPTSGERRAMDDALAAREAARIIAYWRDYDRRTGETITNAELGRRIGVAASRIGALVASRRGYGPSYALLKRLCTATGRSWPAGLVEALSALKVVEPSSAGTRAGLTQAEHVRAGVAVTTVELTDEGATAVDIESLVIRSLGEEASEITPEADAEPENVADDPDALAAGGYDTDTEERS